jgi:predicted ribosome quality control (RQC) complex YloA/Tae2 family protein
VFNRKISLNLVPNLAKPRDVGSNSTAQTKIKQFKPLEMSEYTFRELELKYGELIYIVNEKGEGISGLYEDEYNNSNETFRFSNYSNGKTETIEINKMHSIQRFEK